MGQRALSAVRPDWKWLLPTSRTVISGVGAVVMFFFRTHPLVVVDASAKDLAHAERLAVNTNNFLGWGLFGPWLWIYLGVGALFYAWYTRPHLRRFLQDRHDRIPSVHELNGVAQHPCRTPATAARPTTVARDSFMEPSSESGTRKPQTR